MEPVADAKQMSAALERAPPANQPFDRLARFTVEPDRMA